MEASSGIAVKVLDVQPNEHVLDLCSAPGAKLCYLADLMKMRGSLTGVDISSERARVCASLLRKYEVIGTPEIMDKWHLRMIRGDGTTFDIRPDVNAEGVEDVDVVLDSKIINSMDEKHRNMKRKNKSARKREKNERHLNLSAMR